MGDCVHRLHCLYVGDEMKPTPIGWVLSWAGDRNFRFDLNPDLEELRRYNENAAQAACKHKRKRYVVVDDGRSYNACSDCRKAYV